MKRVEIKNAIFVHDSRRDPQVKQKVARPRTLMTGTVYRVYATRLDDAQLRTT